MKITVSFDTDATTEDQAKAIVAHLVDYAPSTLDLYTPVSDTEEWTPVQSFSLSNITLVSVEGVASAETEDQATAEVPATA